MSAAPVATNASITERRAAAAKAEREAKLAAEMAMVRVAKRQDKNQEIDDRLASLEADREQNMLAAALDRPPPAPTPSPSELEALRADRESGKHVIAELQRLAAAADKAHTEAQRVCKAQTSLYLQDTALRTARDNLAAAFDHLRDAAVEAMAAHRVAFHDYGERRTHYTSPNDVSGPVAHWIATLRQMNWPDYPYNIRPDWLPVNGQFWADELGGVAEHVALLKASIEQEADA